MEEQTDFLKKIDNGGSFVPPQPPQSPEEIKLKELIVRKRILSQEWDMCQICQGESRGHCSEEHATVDFTALQNEIDELEASIRG